MVNLVFSIFLTELMLYFGPSQISHISQILRICRLTLHSKRQIVYNRSLFFQKHMAMRQKSLEFFCTVLKLLFDAVFRFFFYSLHFFPEVIQIFTKGIDLSFVLFSVVNVDALVLLIQHLIVLQALLKFPVPVLQVLTFLRCFTLLGQHRHVLL